MPIPSLPELVIILVIVILIFGVGRLPEIGGALGKGIQEFRASTRGESDAAKDSAAKDSAAKDKEKLPDNTGEAKKG